MTFIYSKEFLTVEIMLFIRATTRHSGAYGVKLIA